MPSVRSIRARQPSHSMISYPKLSSRRPWIFTKLVFWFLRGPSSPSCRFDASGKYIINRKEICIATPHALITHQESPAIYVYSSSKRALIVQSSRVYQVDRPKESEQ